MTLKSEIRKSEQKIKRAGEAIDNERDFRKFTKGMLITGLGAGIYFGTRYLTGPSPFDSLSVENPNLMELGDIFAYSGGFVSAYLGILAHLCSLTLERDWKKTLREEEQNLESLSIDYSFERGYD